MAVLFACFVAGCAGQEASVPENDGRTNQELQKRKDGSATGDGKTCSWANTATLDTCVSSSGPAPAYHLGDEFKSIDGCNECECTEKGIMCTVRTCDPGSVPPAPPIGGDPVPPSPPIACDASLRICKDGSPAKTVPNSCDQVCPEDDGNTTSGGGAVCTADALKCPDGSYVSRTGPKCEFAPCPATK